MREAVIALCEIAAITLAAMLIAVVYILVNSSL